VVGEAGNGFLHFGRARGSSDGRDIIERGSHGGMRCVGGHVEGVVCASLCVEASQKSVFLSLAVLRAKIFEEHSWPCTFWNYGPPSLKRALSLLADSHSRARHRLTGHVVVSWCEGR